MFGNLFFNGIIQFQEIKKYCLAKYSCYCKIRFIFLYAYEVNIKFGLMIIFLSLTYLMLSARKISQNYYCSYIWVNILSLSLSRFVLINVIPKCYINYPQLTIQPRSPPRLYKSYFSFNMPICYCLNMTQKELNITY